MIAMTGWAFKYPFKVAMSAALIFACALARAAGPYEAAPPYEIPKLDHIAIDGDPSDWQDNGFRVDVMADTATTRPSNFETSFRLGWDDRGLLVLATVSDNTPIESADGKQLAQGDSLDVMLSDNGDTPDGVEVIVAPGRSKEFATSRQQVIVRRAVPTTQPEIIAAETACRSTSEGYTAEARVPWSAIHMTANPGELAGVQVIVHDGFAPGQKFDAVWFPTAGPASPGAVYAVRLSDRPSPAIRAAAFADYQRFRRARVFVTAATQPSGNLEGCTITTPGLPPMSPQMSQMGHHLAAQCWLPMPAPGQAYPFIRVQVGRTLLPELHLPDPTQARAEAFIAQDIRFASYVFDSPQFPTCDFANPALVEDLIGPYTLIPHFYDSAGSQVTTAETPGRYAAMIDVRTDDGKTYKRFATLLRSKDDDSLASAMESFSAAGTADPGTAQLNTFITRKMSAVFQHDPDSVPLLAWLQERQSAPSSDPWPTPEAAQDEWLFNLKVKTHTLDKRYYVIQPPTYNRDPQFRWPLLVFLHGQADAGENIDRYKSGHTARLFSGKRVGPFVVLLPQSATRDPFNPWTVMAMIDEVRHKYRIDDARIYITGVDSGSTAAWQTAADFPGRFAAAALAGGRLDPAVAPRLQSTPMWILAESKDPALTLGDIDRFTAVPEFPHNLAERVYTNPQLFNWLLAQKCELPMSATTRP
jgi:pimeloyl-ACP methyl ester carboxylesterase